MSAKKASQTCYFVYSSKSTSIYPLNGCLRWDYRQLSCLNPNPQNSIPLRKYFPLTVLLWERNISHFSPISHTCLGAIILLAYHNSCDHRQIRVEGSKKNALRQKRLPKPSEIWLAMQQGGSSLRAEFSPFPLSKSHLLYSYLMMVHCYIMFAVLARSNLNKPVSHLNHIFICSRRLKYSHQ